MDPAAAEAALNTLGALGGRAAGLGRRVTRTAIAPFEFVADVAKDVLGAKPEGRDAREILKNKLNAPVREAEAELASEKIKLRNADAAQKYLEDKAITLSGAEEDAAESRRIGAGMMMHGFGGGGPRAVQKGGLFFDRPDYWRFPGKAIQDNLDAGYIHKDFQRAATRGKRGPAAAVKAGATSEHVDWQAEQLKTRKWGTQETVDDAEDKLKQAKDRRSEVEKAHPALTKAALDYGEALHSPEAKAVVETKRTEYKADLDSRIKALKKVVGDLKGSSSASASQSRMSLNARIVELLHEKLSLVIEGASDPADPMTEKLKDEQELRKERELLGYSNENEDLKREIADRAIRKLSKTKDEYERELTPAARNWGTDAKTALVQVVQEDGARRAEMVLKNIGDKKLVDERKSKHEAYTKNLAAGEKRAQQVADEYKAWMKDADAGIEKAINSKPGGTWDPMTRSMKGGIANAIVELIALENKGVDIKESNPGDKARRHDVDEKMPKLGDRRSLLVEDIDRLGEPAWSKEAKVALSAADALKADALKADALKAETEVAPESSLEKVKGRIAGLDSGIEMLGALEKRGLTIAEGSGGKSRLPSLPSLPSTTRARNANMDNLRMEKGALVQLKTEMEALAKNKAEKVREGARKADDAQQARCLEERSGESARCASTRAGWGSGPNSRAE